MRKVVDMKICAICHIYVNEKMPELSVKLQNFLFVKQVWLKEKKIP